MPFARMPVRTRYLVVGMAGVALAGATALALGLSGPAAADEPAAGSDSLLEDFRYPNADAILAAQHVKLLYGDGHITIADCSVPPSGDLGFIEVNTSDIDVNDGGRVCFKVSGNTGVLSMEVPGVFEIRGDGRRTGTGHQITATVKPEGGQEDTIPVDPDGSTQVGIGTSPPGPPTTLLKLEVTG